MKTINTKVKEAYSIKYDDISKGDILIVKKRNELVLSIENDILHTIHKEDEKIRDNTYYLCGSNKSWLIKMDTYLIKPKDNRYAKLREKLK